MRVGVWLLWLCFGLPASAIAFLGIPAMLAWFGVGMLDKVGVPLEVWTELEPWVALLTLATMVNLRASFTHRRAIESGGRSSLVVLWVAGGGLAVLTWAGLLGLELVPRTELHPELHYWSLSAVLVWTGLSLAWVSGRVVSVMLAPVERRALMSGPLRGSLATAGPLSTLALVAVGASLGVDGDDAIDDAQGLVASSFEDDWSLIDSDGSGGGAGAGSSRRGSRLDEDCIDELYRGGPSSLFQRAVRSIASYRYIDAESVAADAAISVCLGKQPEELDSYYLRAVRNRANSSYSRHHRFGECTLPIDDSFRIPTGETQEDCFRQQLCRMEPDDQDVLVHLLMGGTDRELAQRRGIPKDTAKQQRTRAKKRFMKVVERECKN